MRLALEHFYSLISLVNHFNNDKRCRDFITEQRWGKVVVCPFCGCTIIQWRQFLANNPCIRFYRNCLRGTQPYPLKCWVIPLAKMKGSHSTLSSLSRQQSALGRHALFILFLLLICLHNPSSTNLLKKIAQPRKFFSTILNIF